MGIREPCMQGNKPCLCAKANEYQEKGGLKQNRGHIGCGSDKPIPCVNAATRGTQSPKEYKKTEEGDSGPINVSTMYFQAASRASRVFSNPTSRTERSVVSSTAIQTNASSTKRGTASRDRRNRL